ncbi:MAG TPA: protein-glutamate O-methyltransferase CheR [Gemmatimonadaceae bacterium]|nr:protein-glutamate O-methyltransferase CheR [Gemmatimonadaceae bacterium]
MKASAGLPHDVVEAASEVVRRRTGLVFGDARRATLEAALAKAIRAARTPDPGAYLDRLAVDAALLDELVGAITVGETYFFRDPQQFAVIRGELIPALLGRHRSRRDLRVWSAGCASGEETYSLAIVLQELGLLDAAHVLGTDISRSALVRARAARYGRWSFRGVPPEVMATYFEPKGDQFELAAPIRAGAEFRYVNLAEDRSPSLVVGTCGMDLILCRNVLIYFDHEAVARVAQRLMDSLSADGWLLLGASDPLLSGLVECDVVATDAGLAYRKRDARRARAVPPLRAVDHPPLHATDDPPAAPSRPLPEAAPPSPLAAPAAQLSEDEATQAKRCYAERDYVRAGELAGRLCRSDGSDPELWVLLIRALANQGDLETAGRACALALERHGTWSELVYLHAVLLAEGGWHLEAAQGARRALYLDPQLAVAHLALGSALARVGDSVGAQRAFRNAERLLTALPPDATVQGADGAPAARLLQMASAHLRLVREASA